MIPLNEIERQQLSQGNYTLKFAVHKHNPYIADRTITLEEAARCVVYQTKWAASHSIVYSGTKEQLMIDVAINSETEIKGMGRFVIVDVSTFANKFQSQFIVTESRSHWFFLDYGLVNVAKPIEVGQGNTPTVSIAKYD
jgi:hypothetical protein